MPETCDQWARQHVNTRAWDVDRRWCAENAAWLRTTFPEAWAPTSRRATETTWSREYLGRIVDALEHVRTVVDRMAGHLNLSPIWIVPPASRYPMEAGFVTYGPWTSSSARVDAADLQDASTDALRRKIAASIAAGRGTRDSAGTFYTRGGTAFLDPLSGYAPPVLGRLGNRPLVHGWDGSGAARTVWPIRHGVTVEQAARANLITVWQYMDRPDAPYVWWNAPSATAWPTAPVSSARWELGTPTGVLTAAQTGRVRVERAGSIDDGWGRGTGALDTEAGFPMPTPWLGPWANIRYAHAVLTTMAAQSGYSTLTRAIREQIEWARGNVLLTRAYLLERQARSPGDDVSGAISAADETLADIGGWLTLIGGAAAATGTPVGALVAVAASVANLALVFWAAAPGTISGLGQAPAWPGRMAWYKIALDERETPAMAPVPLWIVPPPAGLACEESIARAGAVAKTGKTGGATVWIGGALAAALVGTIAIAVARAGR